MKRIQLVMSVFFLLSFAFSAEAAQKENSSEASPGSTTPGVVVAQASASADAAPAASAEKSDDESEEEKPGWWSISLDYSFDHNLASERKAMTNTVVLSPSFTLPWGSTVSLSAGFFYYKEYDRPNSLGKDLGYNDQFDATPISLTYSHRFSLDPDVTGFALSLSLAQAIPYVGTTQRNVTKHYYSVKPGVGVSVSKWGVSLSNSNKLSLNLFGEPYGVVRGMYGSDITLRNAYASYSNSTRLGYSYDLFSIGASVNWSRSWLYDIDLSFQDDPTLPATSESGLKRDAQPRSSVSYAADVSFQVWDYIALYGGITTAGPERRVGGFQGRLYPLDPLYTNVYVGVTGTYFTLE